MSIYAHKRFRRKNTAFQEFCREGGSGLNKNVCLMLLALFLMGQNGCSDTALLALLALLCSSGTLAQNASGFGCCSQNNCCS